MLDRAIHREPFVSAGDLRGTGRAGGGVPTVNVEAPAGALVQDLLLEEGLKVHVVELPAGDVTADT